MFENILAQEQVVSELKQSISGGTVPGSMLFEGPKYAGKVTTALELARALTCKEGSARWNCPCRSCAEHRALVHNDCKLLGPGDLYSEIVASADVIRRVHTPAALYLFMRSIRKLLMRLDSDLWPEANRNFKSARTSLESLHELADSLQTETGSDEIRIEEPVITEAIELSAKLADIIPKDSIPVDHIRRLSRWAFQTTGGKAKVAVISGIETMSTSTINAMLKILEEPPEDTYFILTTSAPEALLPTIRSRLRPYRFKGRSAEDSRLVLERIFRETSGEYESLADYFLAWTISPELLKNEATAFWNAVVRDSYHDFFSDNRDLSQLTGNKEVFLAFLSELVSGKLSGTGEEGNIDLVLFIDRCRNEIRTVSDGVRMYNISPNAAIDALFHKMRAHA